MENVLLHRDKRHIKVADFSLSAYVHESGGLTTPCGSPEYAAPEMLDPPKEFIYNNEVDIWSFGIILYYLLIGRLPFFSPYYDQRWQTRLLRYSKLGLTHEHRREMAFLSEDCKELLCNLIEPNPLKRITLTELTKNPWITKNWSLPFCVFRNFKVSPLKTVCPFENEDESFLGASNESLKKESLEKEMDKMLFYDEYGHPLSKPKLSSLFNQRLLPLLSETKTMQCFCTKNLPNETNDYTATQERSEQDFITKKIIKKISAFTNKRIDEIEEELYENKNSEASSLFRLLWTELQDADGFYAVDHTSPGWPLIENVLKKSCSRESYDSLETVEEFFNGEKPDSSWWWHPLNSKLDFKSTRWLFTGSTMEAYQSPRKIRRALKWALIKEEFEKSNTLFEESLEKNNVLHSERYKCSQLSDIQRDNPYKKKFKQNQPAEHHLNALGILVKKSSKREDFSLNMAENDSTICRSDCKPLRHCRRHHNLAIEDDLLLRPNILYNKIIHEEFIEQMKTVMMDELKRQKILTKQIDEV